MHMSDFLLQCMYMPHLHKISYPSLYLSAGNFSCLRVDFNLQRSIGFYIVHIYVPSVLIVILSWVSFWLNVDAIPARISLGVLTVLTLTTQGSLAIASLPRVSYIKAIDVWMAVCLFFVFAALLEFAGTNVMYRSYMRGNHRAVDDISDVTICHDTEKVSSWNNCKYEGVDRAQCI